MPGPNGEITESWRALPRDPQAFAAVLAGTAQPAGQARVYDYAANATTTLPGAVLSGGSRLVAVDTTGAAGPVDLGTATLLSTPPSARWSGSLPGTTLLFNGARTEAGLLTTTAVRLDGASRRDHPRRPRLADTGQITLEAWVGAQAHDGIRDIVARGYVFAPDGEVFLRINDGRYEVGSWDGQDHLASCPIPADDLGGWVHLAGTYDGSAGCSTATASSSVPPRTRPVRYR